ncbi:transposase family protein [Streptomyces spiramyceticus]|uniref:transposase family protein n=1 Tax=Streptomyces spiramyceticus TaxID=299717 RepID=UPI0030846DA4
MGGGAGCVYLHQHDHIPHERREGARRREAGAGPRYGLVFVDRLLVPLVHLRTGLTYQALGAIYEVGSSTAGESGQTGPAGVRLGQAEAEHQQDHHRQRNPPCHRRPGLRPRRQNAPPAVGRAPSSWTLARPPAEPPTSQNPRPAPQLQPRDSP